MARTCAAMDVRTLSRYLLGLLGAGHIQVFVGAADGQIAPEWIVCAGLVGDEVGREANLDHLWQNLGSISHQANGDSLARRLRLTGHGDGFIERTSGFVEIARFEAPLNTRGVDFDADADATGEFNRKRLRATHASEASGHGDGSCKGVVEVALCCPLEGLVGPLQDALGADVNPGAGGHLAVHHEAGLVELVEDFPCGPVRDEVGVGDENAWSEWLGFENGDRLTGLNEEGLVVFEAVERFDDAVEAFPVASGFAAAAVNDELSGLLGDRGIEIVHQHPLCSFLDPAARGSGITARRPNRLRLTHAGSFANTIIVRASRARSKCYSAFAF